MPIACHHKQFFRRDACMTECPVLRPGGGFEYARVERPLQLPVFDPRVIDVAVLDMNHGWPNLGHDSIVHAVQDAACDIASLLEPHGLRVRVCSFDVRRSGMLPEAPGGRFALYLGTGGPGHLDPQRNDGVSEGTQGLYEDPAWEPRLFELFDQVLADPRAALLAVCHTFGVMCRWSGVAAPMLRSESKGGKSAGILENYLTAAATEHPWFARFSTELPEGRRLRIVDHRLYDLVPNGRPSRQGMVIGNETLGVGGVPGDAVTMVEWARDAGGVMPRVFGVNHHPEIVDRTRQMMILRAKLERGEVTRAWYDDRLKVLTDSYPDDTRDQRLHLTSDFTLLGPLRFYLHRQVRLRGEALGLEVGLHEDATALLGASVRDALIDASLAGSEA